MLIKKGNVIFEEQDSHFVSKFGREEAAEMVMDYLSGNNLPFIYDTYQLAAFLGVGRKTLFDTVNKVDKLYRKILIPKKNGGMREVSAPQSTLKKMQKIISEKILSGFPVSPYATAYVPGKRLYDNACCHTGKKYILKLDLKDFFGSIRFYQVYNIVFNTHYFPSQIGTILTTLCCKDDVLVQGAPTSPILSNIIMKHFDDVMGSWCEKRGISYSRYCDDITFSSDKPLHSAQCKATSFLENMGFTLNERKTHFVSTGARQVVTGLTVNDKVRVPKDYKRKLRQEIYYILKFGDKQIDLKCIMGKINYVLQIEPDNEYFKNALIKLRA